MEPVSGVKLTDAELMLLDGKCSEGVQAEVEEAKIRSDMASRHDAEPKHIHFASRILREARKRGRLIRQAFGVRNCACCGAEGGYARFKRTCRAGMKGEPNYDKPRLLPAVEYVPRVITRGSSPTAPCAECSKVIEPILIAELANVEAEIPEELSAPSRHKMKRFNRVKCICGWSGHEGEMRQLENLMRDGTYAGGCPECPAENEFFKRANIERVDGFVIVRDI